MEEWGVNLLPSDYKAYVLTIWLKAWTVSQVASSLPITQIYDAKLGFEYIYYMFYIYFKN